MMISTDLSQEKLTISVLTVLKSSLEHGRKHILRSLRLYGDQALAPNSKLQRPVSKITGLKTLKGSFSVAQWDTLMSCHSVFIFSSYQSLGID